jgi:NADPH:quinone reductase-like Zn-dependent oxidoreductase
MASGYSPAGEPIMKAVGLTEFGGPEVLHIVELPDPEAGPGQVRIRVHGAAINPTDTQLRCGERSERLRDVPLPHVPGMEAAGVVEQIGEGVSTELQPGDHVMAVVLPLGPHGAYAARVVVPAASVARGPAGATHAEAATLPMTGLTARMALDVLGLEPGHTLAVTGAAGMVGGYVVQLAKAEGLHVLADAAPGDVDLVTQLGADVVVARGDGFAERVRHVNPQGVHALVDAALMNESGVGAVGDGGQMVTLRGFDSGDVRGITCHPIFVRHYVGEQKKLDGLRQLVEDGLITLRLAQSIPSEHAAEAHRIFERGGTRGRLVLEF